MKHILSRNAVLVLVLFGFLALWEFAYSRHQVEKVDNESLKSSKTRKASGIFTSTTGLQEATELVSMLTHNYSKVERIVEQQGNASAETFPPTSSEAILDISNQTNVQTGMINFVHIAKAGGTTIEFLSRKNNHTCGLWGSRMVGNATYRMEYGGWGPAYIHRARSRINGNRPCRCAEWHMPPALLDDGLRKDLYPAEKTFCLFRDPLEKLISYFYYHHTGARPRGPNRRKIYIEGPCFNSSAAHMNEVLLRDLKKQLANPCFYMCHLMPQNEYFKGHEDLVTKHGLADPTKNKQCDEILLLDDQFDANFDKLMENINCPIRYNNFRPKNVKEKKKCGDDPGLYGHENAHFRGKRITVLGKGDLSPEVLELARQIYGKDMDLYERLSQERRASSESQSSA